MIKGFKSDPNAEVVVWHDSTCTLYSSVEPYPHNTYVIPYGSIMCYVEPQPMYTPFVPAVDVDASHCPGATQVPCLNQFSGKNDIVCSDQPCRALTGETAGGSQMFAGKTIAEWVAMESDSVAQYANSLLASDWAEIDAMVALSDWPFGVYPAGLNTADQKCLTRVTCGPATATTTAPTTVTTTTAPQETGETAGEGTGETAGGETGETAGGETGRTLPAGGGGGGGGLSPGVIAAIVATVIAMIAMVIAMVRWYRARYP